MKILDKNIEGVAELEKQLEIQQMQTLLLTACMRNDLSLATTIGVDKDGQYYMSYAVRFHGENRDVFIGQAHSATDTYYNFVVRAVSGQVVSEVYPPAIPSVTTNDEEPPGDSIPVAYWKNRFYIDYDTTVMVSDKTNLNETKGESAWAGYNSKHEEIIRVKHGAENPGYELIERIQYVDLGENGTVVAVMYKNDVLEEGQEPTLGQALQMASKAKIVALQAGDTSFSLPPGEMGKPLSEFGAGDSIVENKSSEEKRSITLQDDVTVSDLAGIMEVPVDDVIDYLLRYKVTVTANSYVPPKYAKFVGKRFGFEIIYLEKHEVKTIDVPEVISVADLAKRLGTEPRKVIKALSDKGMFATVNQALDRETASIAALHLGWRVRQPTKVVIPESIRIDELATLLGTPVILVLRVLDEMCVPSIRTSNVGRVLDDNMAEQVARALGFEVSKSADKTPAQKTEEARLAVAEEVAKIKAQQSKKDTISIMVKNRKVLTAAEYDDLNEADRDHYRHLLTRVIRNIHKNMSDEGAPTVKDGNYCRKILDSEFLRKDWEKCKPSSGPKPTLDYYIAWALSMEDKLFFAIRGAKAPKYLKTPSKKSGVTPVEGRKATAKVAVKKPSSRKPTEKKEDGETSIE